MNNYSLLDLLSLIGAVGLFLYGMTVMSEGLQKVAGDRMRNILSAMTRNRFAGLLTGCAITALIQSSSASTVMVVSFVNAGLMTLAESIAVIFGANVGTTFTAWIITVFGFKVDVGAVVLPVIAVAIVLLFMNKNRLKSTGEFLIGFALLFMGLTMISDYVPDLKSNPEMFEILKGYADMGFMSVMLFMLVGAIVTGIIQSSAAMFAIVLIMSTKGWIPFNLACAVILGSNIGTTVTPLLAALKANIAAKRTAIAHLLFNTFGTIWCLCVFVPFAAFIAWITTWLGEGDPNALYEYANSTPLTEQDPEKIQSMALSVSYGMSMFHTMFNIVNVCIMIWFTKLYVKILEWLVPAHKQEDEFTLTYISGGLLKASELNIAQAEKEIGVYAERVSRMIQMGHDLIHTKEKSEDFNKLFSRLEKYEDISDRMEIEIASYLNRCAEGRLSSASKRRIAAMLTIIGEIESIADCCFGIGKILNRKIENNTQFTEEIYKNIDTMYRYIAEASEMMIDSLKDLENVEEPKLMASYNKEREINNLRNSYRSANIENINSGKYEYQAGIYYMDIVSDLERTGDYIINVTDTIKENFLHKHV